MANKLGPLPPKWVEALYETLLLADGKTRIDGRAIASKHRIDKVLPVNALKYFCSVVSESPKLYKYEKNQLPSDEECKKFFKFHRDFQRKASKANAAKRSRNTPAFVIEPNERFSQVDIIIELASKGIDVEMIRYIGEIIKHTRK